MPVRLPQHRPPCRVPVACGRCCWPRRAPARGRRAGGWRRLRRAPSRHRRPAPRSDVQRATPVGQAARRTWTAASSSPTARHRARPRRHPRRRDAARRLRPRRLPAHASPQAEAALSWGHRHERLFHVVILLEVDDPELVRRIVGRGSSSGRSDDQCGGDPRTARRLHGAHGATDPVLPDPGHPLRTSMASAPSTRCSRGCSPACRRACSRNDVSSASSQLTEEGPQLFDDQVGLLGRAEVASLGHHGPSPQVGPLGGDRARQQAPPPWGRWRTRSGPRSSDDGRGPRASGRRSARSTAATSCRWSREPVDGGGRDQIVPAEDRCHVAVAVAPRPPPLPDPRRRAHRRVGEGVGQRLRIGGVHGDMAADERLGLGVAGQHPLLVGRIGVGPRPRAG